jgi:hypothetical protein
VPFAQVFTDEYCASLEASVQLARLLAPSQSVQEPDRLLVETAKRHLLDPVGNHPGDDVLGESLGRDGAEHRAPALSECVDAEGPDLVYLGLDRSGINRPLIHG